LYEFTSRLDRFVTLAAAVLDPTTHEVVLVSAGHDAPLLYRPGSGDLTESMSKDVAGVPLGIMEGYPFESCRITLQPQECLLLFTDGVHESRSATDVEFQRAGIDRTLKGVTGLKPKDLVSRLVAAVNRHAAGRENGPHDDLTVVALGRS
jgi:sigma-B regulation protein RsbU (phosphoserine phosphatase)